jgi:hypothetical protein
MSLVWKSRPSAATKPRHRKHITQFQFKAPFTISSNAFRTQEWLDLARDDVSRLRLTLPLVKFFGWLVGASYMTHPVRRNNVHVEGRLHVKKNPTNQQLVTKTVLNTSFVPSARIKQQGNTTHVPSRNFVFNKSGQLSNCYNSLT